MVGLVYVCGRVCCRSRYVLDVAAAVLPMWGALRRHGKIVSDLGKNDEFYVYTLLEVYKRWRYSSSGRSLMC